MTAITITLAGTPVAKGRPRMTRAGHAYTPAKTRTFEAAFRAAATEAMKGELPHGSAVSVTIEATLPIAKSLSATRRFNLLGEFHQIRPDIDNIAKAATDAMNGIVYHDDSQIAVLVARKRWGDPGLVVIVEPL